MAMSRQYPTEVNVDGRNAAVREILSSYLPGQVLAMGMRKNSQSTDGTMVADTGGMLLQYKGKNERGPTKNCPEAQNVVDYFH